MKVKTRFLVFIIIILFTLALFACIPAAPESTFVPVTDTPSPSPSKTMVPNWTMTPSPTDTLIPTDVLPLEKVLLTDYFVTPSPIFDLGLVITATPGIAQKCPILDDTIDFDRDFFVDYDVEIEDKESYLLDYLNRGGDVQSVIDVYSITPGYSHVIYQDVTGDGVSEIMLTLRRAFPAKFQILGCENGKYEQLYQFDLHGDLNIYNPHIIDFNLDHLPETYLPLIPQAMSVSWSGFIIIGWDGDSFTNLVTQTEFDNLYKFGSLRDSIIGITGYSGESRQDKEEKTVQDIDANGTLEILVTGGLPASLAMKTYGPAQTVTQTYMWNGEGFILEDLLFGSPEYRYQAVQNGDLYALMHKYDRAYELYRQAIDDPQLEWWSEERSVYYGEYTIATYYDSGHPIPTLPSKDEHEYAYLAAYAQFRIILLDVIQKDVAAALAEYRSMEDTYKAGEDGYVYLQYASAFLDEYLYSEDIYHGCQAANDFGIDNEEELLHYVAGNPRGQSAVYTLESICPFQ